MFLLSFILFTAPSYPHISDLFKNLETTLRLNFKYAKIMMKIRLLFNAQVADLNLNIDKLMSALISEISVKSSKKVGQTYFKLNAGLTYLSKVSQNDVIKQTFSLPVRLDERISLQIWTYDPQCLLKCWTIDAVNFHPKNKYKIVEKQWSVIFVLCQKARGVSQNKQNVKQKNLNSISHLKDLKIQQNGKKHNKSRVKDINLVLQQKKKTKAGVKKALKSTIDYLMKQANHEDYGMTEPQHPRTGKCTPCIEQLSYVKSQSSLYSDYGFSSSQFSKRFEEREFKGNGNDVARVDKQSKMKFR